LFITFIENFVYLSTMLAVLCFAFAWSIRQLSLHKSFLHPLTLSRLYAAAILLPPVFAMWILIAAFLPEWRLNPEAFKAAHSLPAHNLHLLSEVTASLEPNLAYLTICCALCAALFAVWSGVRSYLKVGGLIERLTMNATPPPPPQVSLVEKVAAQYGLDVGLVMSDYPFSFVWGYWRSRIVLSSGLLSTLTPKELLGVLEHEIAHHKRRDNLAKLSLSILSYLSLAFPLSRLLLRWRAEQVELVCDEIAVTETAAPLEIAEALVKLRRHTVTTLSQNREAKSIAAPSFFMPHNEPDRKSFAWRVHRLIAFADSPPLLGRVTSLLQAPGGTAIMLGIFFSLSLISTSLYAPLAVHRVAESIIHFIK